MEECERKKSSNLPDLQYLPDVVVGIGFSGDDEQSVEQVERDAVGRTVRGTSNPRRGTGWGYWVNRKENIEGAGSIWES